ncbi:hypothetical protein [Candidatus Nitrosocosmicus arcticus]|nr:hypothetical protein [Candidatus Nitrosocosmicus arcticus]
MISNKSIRRGDLFGIYVEIINGNPEEITIKRITLTAPMGFSKGSEPSPLLDQKLPYSKIAYVFQDDIDRKIAKDDGYTHNFLLRAGFWWGTNPKPDTHIVLITVEYNDGASDTQEFTNVSISIFPSFSSMLIGTIAGGILGTLANSQLISRTNVEKMNPEIVLPILFVNIILSFIAGVILMRRKDVQSFITVEDFWGGLLMGFVVGYVGFEGLLRLFGITDLGQPISAPQT